MKKTNLKSLLTIVLVLVLMTSCQWQLDFNDTSYDDEPSIATMQPEITAEYVLFKGDLKVPEESSRMQYGFFWYDPNDPDSADNPNKINVGSTSSSVVFTEVITSLPVGTELVVCAFVDKGGYEEMTIGDEVTFILP